MVEPTWEIRQGDVLERLREMPDESVHCVVTSPPYWGLRDYGTAQWDGGDPNCQHNQGANFVALGDCECGAVRIDEQIGLELTPEAYVTKIVAVFSEVRRVLRNDGTLWLNLGDSYASAWATSRRSVIGEGSLVDGSRNSGQRPNRLSEDVKEKDLVGIPWLVAFALRADGWYLRSDIIWSKPNPMPESVTDRPTKSHEYVFLLSKSARYYYDGDAIREPYNLASMSRYGSPMMGVAPTARQPGGDIDRREREKGLRDPNPLGRNSRTVWTITTQPFSEAHFATFPERLVDRCISAGTSEKGVCGECGKPWVRIVERESVYSPVDAETIKAIGREDGNGYYRPNSKETGGVGGLVRTTTTGWRSQCDHSASPVPAMVLDVFSGSGTSGVAARKLGRNYIGIELNPLYVAMSERRLRGTIYQAGLFGE